MRLRKKDKKDYRSDWSEFSIGEWIRITEIMKDTDLDELDKNSELLAVILKDENVLDYTIPEYMNRLPALSILTKEIDRPALKSVYNLGGTEYRLIRSEEKITAGKFIDFNTFLKNNDNILNEKNLSQVIALLLEPVGEGKEFLEIVSDVDTYMPITDGTAIAFFLTGQFLKRLDIFRRFLVRELVKAEGVSWKKKIQTGVAINQAFTQVKHLL